MTIHEILRTQFGHESFRGDQEKVIQTLLAGQSSLVLMPTGQGKSLCFQIPSLILPGLTLVVSPLIALMKDQVDQACRNGLKAAFINSSQSRDERERVLKRTAKGEVKLLYLTPERFRKPEIWAVLENLKVDLFVVDEAHCISEWGHDFRPDFTRLGDVRARLGDPVTMAGTATATKEVQRDILKQLHLPESTPIFDEGVKRPNLHLSTIETYGEDAKVRAFLGLHHQNPGAQIVYFSLIQSLESFSRALQKLGILHYVYHGQLQDRDRKRSQEEFLRDPKGVMLATPAFGLGINKQDIRVVFHGEIPGSIEAYYQEAGRAGRDGLEAHGFLLYDEDDVSIQMDFLKWASPEPEFILRVYRLLEKHVDQVKAGGLDYMRKQLHFYHSRDFRLETALNQLERYGFIETPRHGEWIAVEEPTGDLVDPVLHAKRMKAQQHKLLQMVQLTRSENMSQTIEDYFKNENPLP